LRAACSNPAVWRRGPCCDQNEAFCSVLIGSSRREETRLTTVSSSRTKAGTRLRPIPYRLPGVACSPHPESNSILLQPVALAGSAPSQYTGLRLSRLPAMMEMTAMEMTSETRSHKPKTEPCVYELRITLQEIRPPIWRLIQVPDTPYGENTHAARV